MDYKQNLAYALETIERCLRVDFGNRFAAQFVNEGDFEAWQVRMWQKLSGLHPQDILDGYEQLVDTKPNHLPRIPELVEATTQCQRLRLKRAADLKQANSVAALPPPDVVPDSVAKANLAKIRSLLGSAFADMDFRESDAARLARLDRKAKALANHDAELRNTFPNYGKPTQALHGPHKCHVAWCDQLGTLAHSTKGSESWFCATHFRKLL